MRIIIALGGLSLAVALTAACGRGEVKGPDAPITTSTSARIATNDTAIERITTARCDREVACNNVGAGKSYGTREACTNELGHDKRADLRAEECPRGISEPDLNDCLADIRSEKCGNPLDSISRLAACRKGKLCLTR
jgi:Family of unknown function (DUF6184)